MTLTFDLVSGLMQSRTVFKKVEVKQDREMKVELDLLNGKPQKQELIQIGMNDRVSFTCGNKKNHLIATKLV